MFAEYGLVNIRSTVPKWPVRSVEALPTFERKTLSNRILVIGNSVSHLPLSCFRRYRRSIDRMLQVDPITPLKNAEYIMQLLGSENAVLVEHQAVGHTTLAQRSTCTRNIVSNFLLNSQVGYSSTFSLHIGWR